MTPVPPHLLDLARMADHTKPGERPDMARRVARLIKMCLPPDDPGTCARRRADLDADAAGWTKRTTNAREASE